MKAIWTGQETPGGRWPTRSTLALALVLLHLASSPPTADVTLLNTGSLVPPAVAIVGRTFCRDRVWVLTESGDLISARPDWQVTRVAVTGTMPTEHLWGLACADNQTLWTLASAHVAAALTFEGEVTRRLPLEQPGLSVFSVAGKVLLLRLRFDSSAAPLEWLVRRPTERRVAPDLSPLLQNRANRDRAVRTDPMASVVVCGATQGTSLPCWRADDVGVVLVRAGAPARRLSLPRLVASTPSLAPQREHPPDAPLIIWDAFVDPADATWVLTTTDGQDAPLRAGGHLTWFDPSGRPGPSARLNRHARLIVGATASKVYLLDQGTGHVAEVSRP